VAPIIIDEPELSMHIDWQHDLLAALRVLNPQCQIIVATHSPEVMADVPDDKIFRL
jgi:predicted ATP-dependent endonuclease of OLD family